MAVPITNFTLQNIANELFVDVSEIAEMDELFQHEAIQAEGLDATYNPEGTPAARLAALKTQPYEIGRWRNYEAIIEEGLYTLTNPFGAKFKGVYLYLSSDGRHLYIMGYLAGYDWRIVQYYLTVPKFVSTASYVRNLSIEDATYYHSGYQWVNIQFSGDGTRMMLLMGTVSTAEADSYILTIVLSTAWNISTESSSYETQLQTLSGYRKGLGFAFSETGNKLFHLVQFSSVMRMFVYNLSSNYVLPSTSDSDDFYGNFSFLITWAYGLSVSTSNSKIYIGRFISDYDYKVSYVAMSLTGSSIVCNGSLYTLCEDDQLRALADFVPSSDYGVLYFLEDNVNVSDPNFPRIAVKVSPY